MLSYEVLYITILDFIHTLKYIYIYIYGPLKDKFLTPLLSIQHFHFPFAFQSNSWWQKKQAMFQNNINLY